MDKLFNWLGWGLWITGILFFLFFCIFQGSFNLDPSLPEVVPSAVWISLGVLLLGGVGCFWAGDKITKVHL